MSRRLPRPDNAVRARCELSADELRAVEDAAHLCRLSVASFIRVALIEATAHHDRLGEWQAVAARLWSEGQGGPTPPADSNEKRSRGRPPKKPKK